MPNRADTRPTLMRRGTTILAAVLGLLAACNGPTQTAGIQGSGIPVGTSTTAAVGPITGFGSIFVNAVEYATPGAQILIDGQAGTESQLEPGQIVTVKGTVNPDGATGSATEVDFSGDVQGPVAQTDPVSGTLAILGQTVAITAATVLDPNIQPADISGLQPGVAVEVSGSADASGRIVASRVDLRTAGNTFQVRGAVQGLDTTAHKFQINALTVNYAAAMTTGTLANGSTVEVRGTTLDSGGALLATHVEVLPGIGAAANQRADLDGIITTFTSSTDFVVLGQHVATDSNTHVNLHGATLALNLEIDVKGQFDASGTLVAQTIEAKPRSSSYVRGMVTSVNASGNTLSVLGVDVVTSRSTALEDRSKQHLRQFRLTDLRVGDYVEADGTEGPPGTLNAAVLERKNNESRFYLQGIPTSVSQPALTVLGVTVNTTTQTVVAGASGLGTFFSQATNRVVRVRGTFANGVFTADQVQIVQ